MPTVELLSAPDNVRVIAIRNRIRTLDHLNARFGKGRWRKLSGFANVRVNGGVAYRAEIHYYEAHGIDRVYVKVM